MDAEPRYDLSQSPWLVGPQGPAVPTFPSNPDPGARWNSPTDPQGRPLHAIDPEENLLDTNQYQSAQKLSQAMAARYQSYSPWLAAQKTAAEILPNTEVHAHLVPHLQSAQGGEIGGVYHPANKYIELNTSPYFGFAGNYQPNTPMLQAANLVHEVGHAADDTAGFKTPDGWNPGLFHHRDFVQLEPELAQTMDTQRAIEHGWPVNAKILDRYPWLKELAPNASNKLATPWGFRF